MAIKSANDLFDGKSVKKNIAVDLASMDKENKKVQSFMLEPTIKELLLNHFKSKGITWGAGLRMIIIEYLKNEKLIK